MPRPIGSKNKPGSKKPGPKPGSKNKSTPQKRQMEAIAVSSKRARIEPSGLAAAVLSPGAHTDLGERVTENGDVKVDVCGGTGAIAIGGRNDNYIDVGCVTGRLGVSAEATATASIDANGAALTAVVACNDPSNQTKILPEHSVSIPAGMSCPGPAGYLAMGHRFEEANATGNCAGRGLEVVPAAHLPPAVGVLPMPPVSPSNAIPQMQNNKNSSTIAGLEEGVEPQSEDSKGGVESPRRRAERPVRLSPAMRRHIAAIKKKIDANMRHKGGRAAPTNPGAGYPFDGPLILPGCPTMGHGTGAMPRR